RPPRPALFPYTTLFRSRVHAFGTRGNAEVLGETELVLRMSGARPERRSFAAVDSLRAELEAFAAAVRDGVPFPISPAQMLDTVRSEEHTSELQSRENLV